MRPQFAVVLTHNRPEALKRCIDAILPQVNIVFVMDNASDPPASYEGDCAHAVKFIRVPDQPPNISKMWNAAMVGIYEAMPLGSPDAWDIAFLCDDTEPPEGWLNIVSETMRASGCVAGSTHQYIAVESPIIKRGPDSDIHNRMCGWAFVVAGEAKLWANEDLHWWWCDTWMDFQARGRGGMVICPGPVVYNHTPNDWTNRKPNLAERAGIDGQKFAEAVGFRPW